MEATGRTRNRDAELNGPDRRHGQPAARPGPHTAQLGSARSRMGPSRRTCIPGDLRLPRTCPWPLPLRAERDWLERSQTYNSKYALMWQWSGGGGVRNGIGDFDQIDSIRLP